MRGKIVLITGASSDIGLACMKRYLQEGCSILAQYRTPRPELSGLAAEHEDRVTLLNLDLVNSADLEAYIEKNISIFASTDVVVHLAAHLEAATIEEAGAAELKRAFQINTISPTLISNAIVPYMIERGWGRIVNGSSIGVKYGGGRQSYAYSMSKHAFEFIPLACKDWARSNVFMNVARIGVTETRMHSNLPEKNMDARISLIPAGRAAKTTEIAEAIYHLGSAQNTYISGQIIAISGGE